MIKRITSVIITGLFVGTLVALLVQFFLYSADFLTTLFRKNYDEINFEDDYSYFRFFIYFFAIPIFIGVLVGLIRNLNKDKRWHGPPDVILSVHQDNKELNIKSGFLTTIASILSISVGSSVGQYGPLVHFGGTIGAEIKKLFSFAPDYKILVSAGVASAISSGFGAPLAGLIFAREVILRHQSLASFSPILLSSIISYVITTRVFDYEPAFEIPFVGINTFGEIIILIFAGLFAGIFASFYSYLLTTKKLNFLNFGNKPFLLPAYAALICALVSIKFPEVTGIGAETINSLLNFEFNLTTALIFLFLKISLTTICIRMGLIGGIFAPALFIGSSLGVITFYIGSVLFPDINPTIIIISSMAALASCIIGGPIANVLIVFELTSNYEAALSSGICIVVATIVSSQLIGQSTFDRLLRARSIDIQDGRDILYLKNIMVKNIINKDFLKLYGNTSVRDAIEMFKKSKCSEAYYTDEKGILINKILLTDLLDLKVSRLIKSVVLKKSLIINSDENLIDVMEKCKDFVGESIPVTDKSQKLLGIFSENDLFIYYSRAQEIRKTEETKS